MSLTNLVLSQKNLLIRLNVRIHGHSSLNLFENVGLDQTWVGNFSKFQFAVWE